MSNTVMAALSFLTHFTYAPWSAVYNRRQKRAVVCSFIAQDRGAFELGA